MTRDIESAFKPTHDELARQRFVSTIRKHAIVDLRGAMKSRYEDNVLPQLNQRGQSPENWRDIDQAMSQEQVYRFYSSVRYNAQEMCYQSVRPTVERALPEMIDILKEAQSAPHGGSLRLNPDLEIPRYVSSLDVHLVPGYSHAEFTQDDVANGAVVAFGGKVFTGLASYRKATGAVGDAVGYWVSIAYPELKPRRILDLGTASGGNLMPMKKHFPDAELYGIDVGAPVLRYGHARAEFEGIPVHFSQQNAVATDFPDGYFDLITSSFFYHEVPLKVTRESLKECHRLLAPGGVIAHMELPDESAISDYENFFWNWDTLNNSEPFYTKFRSHQPVPLCVEAGFEPERCFAHMVPSVSTFGEAHVQKFVRGEVDPPEHGQGGWFVFGGQK